MVNWYNTIKLKAQNEPGNPAVAREQAKFEAANRLHQMFMMGVVDYYHSQAGANQSPGEEARLSQIIKSDAAYQEMVGFVHNRSTALHEEERAALGHLSPAALYLYQANRGTGNVAGKLRTQGVAAPIDQKTIAGPPRRPGDANETGPSAAPVESTSGVHNGPRPKPGIGQNLRVGQEPNSGSALGLYNLRND